MEKVEHNFDKLYEKENYNYKSISDFKELLVNKRIVDWDSDFIKLDDDTIITIEMTESDCCAYAGGEFKDVTLDAMVTDVHMTKYEEGKDDDDYGVENKSEVVIFHNRNVIAKVEAEAGHNGYYYSVGAFKIKDVYIPIIEA